MRGAFWPTVGMKIEDLYDRRVTVYRNTTPLKNRARQRDYIWAIDDDATGKTLAIATEVPLVGPLLFLPGSSPAVIGHIPPGQLILSNAFTVTSSSMGKERNLGACICTSDGEVWSAADCSPA